MKALWHKLRAFLFKRRCYNCGNYNRTTGQCLLVWYAGGGLQGKDPQGSGIRNTSPWASCPHFLKPIENFYLLGRRV